MENSKSSQWFKKGSFKNAGELLYSTKATLKNLNDRQSKIQFHANGLIQIDNNSKETAYIQYDFDTKWSFTENPCEITFEKLQAKVVFSLQSSEQLQKWRKFLKEKINQRGFHQQFKPIKKIGKGNFASVYLAQKLQTKTNFAVKAFSKEAAYSQDKGKQCLIKQIQVMRHLDHKNNMKLHEVFQSQNSLYIIFELLQGGQLYDKVKAKYKFKSKQTQMIIHGILQGLKEMHAKKIMHRDLKPQNLLFRKEGDFDCVIADFGLSEFSNVDQYLFVRCGTPGYVAPQVINIKDMKTKYDPICDMFSLGLIFHILLLGKSAFPGTTYNQVLSQNRAANIKFSQEDRKKVSEQSMDLLQRMLKKNPTERITAEDALKHDYFKLNNFQEQQGGQIGSVSTKYPECDSPLLTSANPKRKGDKNLKKDSCVDFQMGKQNMMTGKTETVGQMSSKLSGIDHQAIKKTKVSQFCAEKK